MGVEQAGEFGTWVVRDDVTGAIISEHGFQIEAQEAYEAYLAGGGGAYDEETYSGTDLENEWWEGVTGGREFITPQEEWEQFRTQFAPGWRRQAALEDTQRRLQSRYMLSRPYMDLVKSATAGVPPRDPTFYDYLSDPSGVSGRVSTLAGLRTRAGIAAKAAGLTQQEFGEQYMPEAGGGTGWETDFNRAAWHRRQLAGGGAQKNIATMLALQRPDIADPTDTALPSTSGGAYRGNMAAAIRSAMGDVYQARLAKGGMPSDFLSWYLGATKSA
jgi:hypothetical protein